MSKSGEWHVELRDEPGSSRPEDEETRRVSIHTRETADEGKYRASATCDVSTSMIDEVHKKYPPIVMVHSPLSLILR